MKISRAEFVKLTRDAKDPLDAVFLSERRKRKQSPTARHKQALAGSAARHAHLKPAVKALPHRKDGTVRKVDDPDSYDEGAAHSRPAILGLV